MSETSFIVLTDTNMPPLLICFIYRISTSSEFVFCVRREASSRKCVFQINLERRYQYSRILIFIEGPQDQNSSKTIIHITSNYKWCPTSDFMFLSPVILQAVHVMGLVAIMRTTLYPPLTWRVAERLIRPQCVIKIKDRSIPGKCYTSIGEVPRRGSWYLILALVNNNLCPVLYRQTCNKRRTLVGNNIVDHSDVVGASPVGAAPTTSSFST